MASLNSSEFSARHGICIAKRAACECEIKLLDAIIKSVLFTQISYYKNEIICCCVNYSLSRSAHSQLG